jgi:hypothetical protein
MAVLALTLMLASLGSGQIAGRVPPEPRAIPAFNPVTCRELGQIRSDVRKGRDEGSLSKRQAKELRREAREVAMLERRYSQGGLSSPEAAELRTRIEVLRALTRAKRIGTIK